MTDRLQEIKEHVRYLRITEDNNVLIGFIKYLVQEVERVSEELGIGQLKVKIALENNDRILERGINQGDLAIFVSKKCRDIAKLCADISESDIGHNHPKADQNTCNIVAEAIRKEFNL